MLLLKYYSMARFEGISYMNYSETMGFLRGISNKYYLISNKKIILFDIFGN
jgi:hypothetical protein